MRKPLLEGIDERIARKLDRTLNVGNRWRRTRARAGRFDAPERRRVRGPGKLDLSRATPGLRRVSEAQALSCEQVPSSAKLHRAGARRRFPGRSTLRTHSAGCRFGKWTRSDHDSRKRSLHVLPVVTVVPISDKALPRRKLDPSANTVTQCGGSRAAGQQESFHEKHSHSERSTGSECLRHPSLCGATDPDDTGTASCLCAPAELPEDPVVIVKQEAPPS
jgi:hypothetical protein